MSKKDLFRNQFDDGTIAKLTIFEDYFKEWLPVFISKSNPFWKEIQIFDLFAGEGKDIKNIYGSPMRIIEILNANRDSIVKSNVKIKLIINEFEK
jgi:three-Cys-motif partner protein